jgi:C_GCAxxG_C_C family probable redox protein
MGKREEALKCFNDGFNCAQSVFSSFCEDLGLNKETALKISTSFGGGMGHNGETCGAVTGALMAIGLKYGRTSIEDIQARDKTNKMVQEFINKFKERYGSINCTRLLGMDLGNPEELKKAKEINLTRTVCPKFVADAAEILEKIINN